MNSNRKAHKIEEKERTDDIRIEECIEFSGMYLNDEVLKGLNNSGFIQPSPIQLSAIPLGRCGLDLIVQAKSGTGKTLVFAVIALEMISTVTKSTQVLIVAPTREIAVQITQVISSVGASMPDLRAYTFIGGIDIALDKSKLNCCHIAIGTPGRLAQLVELGVLNLENVRLLVFDEADQLLKQSCFHKTILQLCSTLPHNKQVLMCSATYPEEVMELTNKLMRSPNHVRLGKDAPALLGVKQYVLKLTLHRQQHITQKNKLKYLISILSNTTFNQCLVFTNSQIQAESISNKLRAAGWPTSCLHGAQPQQERLTALDALCNYKCRILVSTDLSARGLDSEHVNLVVNYDIPRDYATYLHRVGRAGRFGSMGSSVSFSYEGLDYLSLQAIATIAHLNITIIDESDNVILDNNSDQILELLDEETLAGWIWKQECNIKSRNKKFKNQEKSKKDSNDTSSENRIAYNENMLLELMEKSIDNNVSPTISFSELYNDCKKIWNELSVADNPSLIKVSRNGKTLESTDEENLQHYIDDCMRRYNKVQVNCDIDDLKVAELFKKLIDGNELDIVNMVPESNLNAETSFENQRNKGDKIAEKSNSSIKTKSGHKVPSKKKKGNNLNENNECDMNYKNKNSSTNYYQNDENNHNTDYNEFIEQEDSTYNDNSNFQEYCDYSSTAYPHQPFTRVDSCSKEQSMNYSYDNEYSQEYKNYPFFKKSSGASNYYQQNENNLLKPPLVRDSMQQCNQTGFNQVQCNINNLPSTLQPNLIQPQVYVQPSVMPMLPNFQSNYMPRPPLPQSNFMPRQPLLQSNYIPRPAPPQSNYMPRKPLCQSNYMPMLQPCYDTNCFKSQSQNFETDQYILMAQKFSSMMNYTKSMGQMSYHLAKQFQNQ